MEKEPAPGGQSGSLSHDELLLTQKKNYFKLSLHATFHFLALPAAYKIYISKTTSVIKTSLISPSRNSRYSSGPFTHLIQIIFPWMFST